MKVCSVCGCYSSEDAVCCPVCGVNFPEAKKEMQVPVVQPSVNSMSVPSVLSEAASQETKYNRMAIAGFVLSLMGVATCIGSFLQLAGLLLSSASVKKTRLKGFSVAGIIISSVALSISMLIWLILILNGDLVLEYISNIQ